MNKTIAEDWLFTITVTEARDCRMGFESGDTFTCDYACPAGFCPKTMAALHTLCEIARCGGDYCLRGSKRKNETDFVCADGCVRFHLKATHIPE